MTEKELMKACRDEINRALKFGREHFKVGIKRPKVVFSKTHYSNGGHFSPSKNIISLNYWMMMENGMRFVMRTPSHEAGHAVMHAVHGYKHQAHGAEWKGFMRRIERSDKRCHSFRCTRQEARAEVMKKRRKKKPVHPASELARLLSF